MPVVATDFVRLLGETQLLADEQLAEVLVIAPAFATTSALASELVRRGWLTPFQLDHLNNGTHGDLMLGPYVLLAALGQGGMGMVYKARHRRLERLVALKVISPTAMSGEAVQRLYREARAIARLKHPNIVLLYDAAEIDGKHFLALEYVDGVDLDRLVRQKGPFPIGLACDCIRQAALGLQHAHERGLVHRDIKPSNLVMTRARLSPGSGWRPEGGEGLDQECAQDAVIKILDLGLVRLHRVGAALPEGEKLSVDGYVVGTPDYVAPEQALDSHTVDIRADIYSLGCTFYELLAGRPPFAAVANNTQKMLSHLQEQPPALSKLRPDVPAEVLAVLRKMMAKEPRERFQTPGQVADALIFAVKPEPPPHQPDKSALPVPPSAAAGEWGAVRSPGPYLAQPKKPALYGEPPKELPEHAGAVRCIAVSQDGRRALSGGDDQALCLWDVPGAEKMRRFPGHSAAVLCVAFAPDGRMAVSGGNDGELMLWDVASGQVLGRLASQNAEVSAAAFSPDGKLLLTGGKDQALHLWDVATRRRVRQMGGVVHGRHFDAVTGVAFAPDGARAVSVSLDQTLRIWNTQTGREVHRCEGHAAEIHCVAFSPDAIHVASGGRDGVVRLWGVVSGQEIRRFEGHTGAVHGVAFTLHGRQLLSSGDTTIRLWDVDSGQQLYWCNVNKHRLLCAAITPDSSHILAGGDDGVVRLWCKAL
jgi:serine/threonine protein kinase